MPDRSPPIARRAAGPLVVARRVLLAGICLVLAACNSGGGDDVLEPGSVVTISGVARYEFVPANSGCVGLNYPATELRPIRRATVQLIDAASGAVRGTTTTDNNGSYAITVDPGLNVRVRVRAELKRSGTPSWNVDVRDNTSNTASVLQNRPLYVLDTGAFSSGTVNQTRDVTATTGWNGTSYSATRAAAPFAVLDAIYSAMQLVLSVDATASFPPLDAFWSVNNKTAEGGGSFDDNIAIGDIGTSFYSSGIDSLFLLGEANVDTEEFDDHVIVHEWGHYFEDVFSRSDSIGGPHGPGDRLDMRLAFGEGWATALSGIALENGNYCDTKGTRQANGFRIGIENNSFGPAGWFSEFSILQIIYDLWDADIDGADTGSIGFAPIYEAMTGAQRDTPAHTSIFSFADAVKALTPAGAPLVDALLAAEDINGTGIYGDGETNDSTAGSSDDVLPIYKEIVPNGTLVKVCSNRQFDNDFSGNKLSEYQFLRMSIMTQAQYEFELVTDDATLMNLPGTEANAQSDPDVYFYREGIVQNEADQGLSPEANREYFVTPNELVPGEYVLDIVEFRHRDENTDPDFPTRSCFDVTINQAT